MTDRSYHFATVEVGTYGLVQVLTALRAENRVHHYATDRTRYAWAERALRESFCPSSPKWRGRVLQQGLEIIDNAADALGDRFRYE
jgi:hypothetical protein